MCVHILFTERDPKRTPAPPTPAAAAAAAGGGGGGKTAAIFQMDDDGDAEAEAEEVCVCVCVWNSNLFICIFFHISKTFFFLWVAERTPGNDEKQKEKQFGPFRANVEKVSQSIE